MVKVLHPASTLRRQREATLTLVSARGNWGSESQKTAETLWQLFKSYTVQRCNCDVPVNSCWDFHQTFTAKPEIVTGQNEPVDKEGRCGLHSQFYHYWVGCFSFTVSKENLCTTFPQADRQIQSDRDRQTDTDEGGPALDFSQHDTVNVWLVHWAITLLPDISLHLMMSCSN